MNIVKEEITFERGRSFKVFSPRLRKSFYWHYHPEVELVYVEATHGIRHVGKNISDFVNSDLVLIGPNVPHLNFDYGLDTDYHQIVVQLHQNFLGNIIASVPEYHSIENMLKAAYLGLSFYGSTKERVAKMLAEIRLENRFASLMDILDILHILANSTEFEHLNREDTSFKFYLKDKVRMGTVYDYIHEHFDKNPNVNEVAELVHLSTPSFCRYFKQQTDITFTEFVNRYRINQAKTFLLEDGPVALVCYRVGYESISYFNKLFKELQGETPTEFKKRHSKKLGTP